MKVFCSFAYTGEEESVVHDRMGRVVAALKESGHEVYCNIFDEATVGFKDPDQFMRRALSQLPDYDLVFVIITSPRRSEGLLMEVGAALALHKRVVVAQHESSLGYTYLPTLADVTMTWSDNEELYRFAHNLK